jgi:hypothetical protein
MEIVIIRTGFINGAEYIGHVTKQGNKFVGSVNQVPEANATFHDHSVDFFDTFEEAEDYVIKEWNRRSLR